MDGDGRAEVVFGDPGDSASTTYYRGKVYVAEVAAGASTWSDSALLELRGEAAQDYVGAGLAGGDVDRDGYDDLLIGAPGQDDGGSGAGAWFLVPGDNTWEGENTISSAATFRIDGDRSGDGIGVGHPVVEDLDDDGYLDFAFGGSATDDVWIFSRIGRGSSDLEADDADLLIEGTSGSRLGFALAAGDVDGDGRADLAVGAPALGTGSVFYQWWTAPGTDEGRVLWFGPEALSVSGYTDASAATVQAWGESSSRADLFGSVLAAGDITGDGTSELFVAAPAADSNRGQVYAIGGY
jgi:hypothetical protein